MLGDQLGAFLVQARGSGDVDTVEAGEASQIQHAQDRSFVDSVGQGKCLTFVCEMVDAKMISYSGTVDY